MMVSMVVLISSLLNLVYFFKKKLMALLMLELSFVCVVYLYFHMSFGPLGDSSLFSMMIFLGFLVMDSVLGLCLLILSSRNSSSLSDPFFGL